ncbi:MAG: 4a-hydroxytetrahydrobiopterin dehydratase [Acidimicrobiales bacterium]
MAERYTRAEFARRHDLPDWRILLQGIEAWFVAPSFPDAVAFIGEIADAAESANHHPDLDLRYRRLHVGLTSHDAGGLTDRDAALARTISELAAARGISAEPRVSTRLEVCIDALDIPAVLPFWRATLGYEDDPPEEGEVLAIHDPAGIGPGFWFQQMDAPRPQRNRIHLDVIVPEDEVDSRIQAALAAGGSLVSDAAARAFWILADPEGNEACLCTWEDRSH